MFSGGHGILKWPVDVLLYTLSFCSLEDSLSFSMICKDTYTLASQKVFWITALKNERRVRPIACPYHEDITTHDIHSLRRIALHTRRLERNWNSEKPQILGEITAVLLGIPTLDTLFHVPGTGLYVFHCSVRGTVELWDIGFPRRVSGPFELSTGLCDISQAEDLPGMLTMAMLIQKQDNVDCYQIALLSVGYAAGVFTLTMPLLCDLPVGSQAFYWAIFLDNDIVGALCFNDDAMKLCVVAVNRTTGKESFIITDLPNEESPLGDDQVVQSGTTIVDGNLCILIAGSCVFTVPNSQLPRDDNPDCPSMSILRFEGNFSHFNNQLSISFLTIVTANSPYGVAAMSLNVIETLAQTNKLEITFWIRPEPSADRKHVLVPTTPGWMQGVLHPTGDVDSSYWESIFQTLSGKRGLVLLSVRDEGDDASRGTQVLCLLSCEGQQVTFRDLVLPDFIDLFNVHGLFLDDHLGVVSMIDSTGMLYAIPYA